MCWSLLKIVFQDQAVGSHLHRMVAEGHGSIMYIELEFHRNRAAIAGLDDVIRLSYQGVGAGRQWLSLAVCILIYEFALGQTQCPVTFCNEPLPLIATFIQYQYA